jgi:hypothetical protein
MPENLCPYARRSVGMYLMILPYILLSAPVIIIEALFFKKQGDRIDTWHHRPSISAVIYIMLFMLYCSIYTIIFIWSADKPLADSNPNKVQFVVGSIVWIFTIIVSGGYGIKKLIENIKENIRNKRYEKQFKEVPEKPDCWLVAFYKAHHDKICPKIEWLNVPEKNINEEEDY